MITPILSSRVYYNTFLNCDAELFHHDIRLYQSMKNHSYNVLYNSMADDISASLSSTLLK